MPRPKKTETAEAPAQHAAPRGLSVFERRMANPLGRRSRDIPLGSHLKDWTVRVFTQDAEHPDRHYEAVHDLGYTPCKAEDFAADVASLGYTVNANGYVVRGAHGQDMIMRIPTQEFKAIQMAKARANLAGVRKEKLKDEVAQATAVAHGSQAGDIIHRTYQQEEVVGAVGRDAEGKPIGQ